MSHATICYLLSTIAQTLAAALGIAGGFMAVLLQRNQSSGESHLEILRELPWDDPAAATRWGARLVRGDLFKFQHALDALCARHNLPQNLKHVALQAAAGLTTLGYAQHKYVPIFKNAVRIGIPAILVSLVALSASDVLVDAHATTDTVCGTCVLATAWCLLLLSRLVTWATTGMDVAGYAEWLREAHAARAGVIDAPDHGAEDGDDTPEDHGPTDRPTRLAA